MFWKRKEKEKPKKQATILHPELKRLVQKVYTLKDGDKKIDLYEFKNIDDMPARRYSDLNDFMEDRNRGIDRTELKFNLEQIKENMDKNSMEGATNAYTIINWMLQRMEIAYDTDLILRLISAALFTKDENVLKYDHDVGTYKIELIEKNSLEAFFLSEPIKKYWTQQTISKKDFRIIIEQNNLKKKVLKELKEMGVFGTIGHTENN